MSAWHFIFRSLRRHAVQSAFAAFGIVLGVSVLLFFAALGDGVKTNILGNIVSDRYVEVVPKSVQLGAFQRRGGLFGGSGSGLEDFSVQDLLALEGVVAAYPKQQLSFPSTVNGGASILGENMWAELIADGIEPALVQSAPEERRYAFVDWASIETCSQSSDCGDGATCEAGSCRRAACQPDDELWWSDSRAEADVLLSRARILLAGRHVLSTRPVEVEGQQRWALVRNGEGNASYRRRLAQASLPGQVPPEVGCAGDSYCDSHSRHCEMPVPFLVSPHLLELYNGSVQSMFRGMQTKITPPRLTEEALLGLIVHAQLGEGMLGRSLGVAEEKVTVRTVPLRMVGFSPLAIPIGATLPRGYVERWNAEFGQAASSRDYASIVVELRRTQDLNPVIDAVREDLNLDVHPRYETARKAAGLIGMMVRVFGLLAAVIVGVGALTIAQNFALRNHARRREFGVMRSVGASGADLLRILLGEAAVLGVSAGLLAIPFAWSAAQIANWAFVKFSPDFPYKPSALFIFREEWLVVGVGLALLASLVGALLPAIRVARMDPAEALRARDTNGG